MFYAVYKILKGNGIKADRNALILILPMTIVLVLTQYFVEKGGIEYAYTRYGIEIVMVQLVLLACIMTIIYSYSGLMSGFEIKMQNALLKQQSDSEISYLTELQFRYEQTKSFRHDIKNHYIVLRQLISSGEMEKAEEYLNELEENSELMTTPFACNTGNTVIDVLLSNKLGLATKAGIDVDCQVRVSKNCKIDHVDLCIVFANALDNAIEACKSVDEKEKKISLTAVHKGTFLMIEVKNSAKFRYDNYTVKYGTGLNNIKSVAEKYGGTIETQTGKNLFRINVLLLNTKQ